MKIGIIGFGSIGKRHINNLLDLGYKDITIFDPNVENNGLGLKSTEDYKLFLSDSYDAVLICVPPANQYQYLIPLLKSNKNMLVEKPIVATKKEATEIKKLLSKYTGTGMIDYNMCFHPCFIETQRLLKKNMIGKLYSARFFAGQYLPDWRPHLDYTQSYSAKKMLGGGVALDLIHEVDMAVNLLGTPEGKIKSLAGQISKLEIETEDVVEIIYSTKEKCIVSIHLDYVYRGYKRYFEIIGEKGNLHCDIFKAEIFIRGSNNKIIHEKHFDSFERNEMYLNMMKYFMFCLENNKKPKPSLEEGLVALKIIFDSKKQNNL